MFTTYVIRESSMYHFKPLRKQGNPDSFCTYFFIHTYIYTYIYRIAGFYHEHKVIR